MMWLALDDSSREAEQGSRSLPAPGRRHGHRRASGLPATDWGRAFPDSFGVSIVAAIASLCQEILIAPPDGKKTPNPPGTGYHFNPGRARKLKAEAK